MAASSLLALIDDISALLDDVAVLTKVAATKTSGVMGDDLALNAQQVAGVNVDRELPVVWAVAKGSFVNKLILVPSALLISAFLPVAILPLMVIGGVFLCFEGVEKLAHKYLHRDDHKPGEMLEAVADPAIDMVAFEKNKVKGAVRTDFVLSAEIVVITLGTMAAAPLVQQVIALCAVAIGATVLVYGLVAGIVKLDDFGLALHNKKDAASRRFGAFILRAAPLLMKSLSVLGTFAMFTVGGSIIAHGVPFVEHLVEGMKHSLTEQSAVLAFIATTLIDALVGLVSGAIAVALFTMGKKVVGKSQPATTAVILLVSSALSASVTTALAAQQAPLGGWPQHSRARPTPRVVTPGAGVFTSPPPDAVVLFNGTSLARWTQSDGAPAKWRIVDGAFEVAPGTGAIMSRDSVGDVQLHIEWMSPTPARGSDQDRGNSGVFFGGERYEVQVLDSYRNPTYADGQAASLYGQYPPLVNASRPPGEWQSYDIVYHRPRFSAANKLLKAAAVTVLHNGILVQDDRELVGPTANGSRPPYEAHEDRLPISLQDHEHPVRFRNVWYRRLEALSGETVQYRSPEGEVYRAQPATPDLVAAQEQLESDRTHPPRYITLGVAQSNVRKFREAIVTFSRGLAAIPNDGTAQSRRDRAMMLRWRGHRFLSVREFAKADADLTAGLALDGTNYGILFHLGVLRYLQGNFAQAASLFAKAQPRAPDGGELAGSTDWLWLSLSRAGRKAEAAAMLARKPDSLAAPPGYAYASRLRLYRGAVTPDQLFTPADTADVQIATLSFGLGTWYLVKGDTVRARGSFERAMQGGGWPGFAFMAAEVELQRLRKK